MKNQIYHTLRSEIALRLTLMLICAASLLLPPNVFAEVSASSEHPKVEVPAKKAEKHKKANKIVRKRELVNDSIRALHEPEDELVIVGNDTVSMIIPERNFGRFDRGLFNYLFIPVSKWGFGLTASYGELNTDDIRVLDILQNVDFKGKIYSLKPFLSYFIRSNQSIGLRFNYSHGDATLANLAMDFDDDINFSLKDVTYKTQSFGMSVFYRNYVGLGMAKRFAIFNEIDLGFTSGANTFKRYYDSGLKNTKTIVTDAALNFSPGVCVFIQENIAFNVSFGVFGLKLRHEHQTTDGIDEGRRFTSGANFRFNIFNINFGLMVVI